MSEIKISIVIPIYNSEEWLEKCLNSVENQSLRKEEYEIILIDDGSTDKCPDIIKKFAETYPNVHSYRKENGGVSSARNAGIEMAQGEYIAFIDSDDFVAPNFCEVLTAKSNHADVVICGHDSFYYGTFKKRYVISTPPTKTQEEAVRQFFRKQNCAHIVVTKAFKRELLLNNHIRFMEGRLYEDMMFAFDVICAAKSYEYIEEVLYTYWRHAGSLSGDTSHQKLLDYEWAIQRVLTQKENAFDHRAFSEDIINWMLNNVFSLCKMWLNSNTIPKSQFEATFRLFQQIIDSYKYGSSNPPLV